MSGRAAVYPPQDSARPDAGLYSPPPSTSNATSAGVFIPMGPLDWTDAYLNAAMLLGGMGPVDAPKTPGGKLFAGTYALYCGLVLLVAAGILFAPLLHRLLHHFHWLERGRPTAVT